MAQRFLALDWDQQQLHLVAATVGGGAVRFQRAVVLSEQSSPNPAEAADLGKLLRERLKAAGIAPAPVLACIGRDRVILKEVRYPDVPAHEEPAVVRFQAVKELTDAADEVVIDYAPLGLGSGGEKRAQVLIVRRELVNAYQAVCQAAGLKLAGLTPRPFGSAACLRRLLGTSVLAPLPEPADAAVALVTVGERWAEFCIVRGGNLLQARTLTLGPGLAGEIRRNLAVHAGQSPQNPVRAVYLALSGEQASLREKLVELLDVPVHPFDPFAGAEGAELPASGRGTFIGAIGLLHLQAERRDLPVNFAQAKQPKPPRDPNQRLHILAACLVLVVLLGGFVAGQSVLRSYEDTVVDRDRELDGLTVQLSKEREKVDRIRALHNWEGASLPDELYELTASMPPIRREFKVRSLDGGVEKPPSKARTGMARTSTGVTPTEIQELSGRPVERFHLKLDAPTDAPLNELTENLLKEGKNGLPFYEPRPHTFARGGIYEKDIFIRKRAPADYKQKMPGRAPARPAARVPVAAPAPRP